MSLPSNGSLSAGIPNVAVIGSGYWGANLVRNFHGLGALRVVCDRDSERLKSFRESYPECPTTTSFEEILGDETIPAVAIATPAEMHEDMVRRALMAGKDVFVEKPL